MFRTTLTVLFAALTLSVPAFAQKGATGQDATQAKPLAELKGFGRFGKRGVLHVD